MLRAINWNWLPMRRNSTDHTGPIELACKPRSPIELLTLTESKNGLPNISVVSSSQTFSSLRHRGMKPSWRVASLATSAKGLGAVGSGGDARAGPDADEAGAAAALATTTGVAAAAVAAAGAGAAAAALGVGSVVVVAVGVAMGVAQPISHSVAAATALNGKGETKLGVVMMSALGQNRSGADSAPGWGQGDAFCASDNATHVCTVR